MGIERGERGESGRRERQERSKAGAHNLGYGLLSKEKVPFVHVVD